MSNDNKTQDINQPEIYPMTTSQVAGMFGMPLSGPHLKDSSPPTQQSAQDNAKPDNFSQIVGNLYVKDEHQSHNDSPNLPQSVAVTGTPVGTQPRLAALGQSRFLSFAKNLVPYVIVFSVSIFLYFFFFSKVDFGALLTTRAQVQPPKQSAMVQLEQQNSVDYQKWISGFYFDVSDASALDPEADNSGNGLSNFQKYLLNLNPKSYDSLGLGMADSEALQAGINPLSGNKLTDDQKAILDRYFDFEVISNRLALARLQHNGQVAGAQTSQTSDSSQNLRGAAPGNQPAIVVGQPINNQAATTSRPPVQAPFTEGLNLNIGVSAHLDIPSLKISAPLIWTQDTKNFDKDLQNGVVHYPGTALPGEIGTTYISGHSSNYVWAKGSFNHVFTHLDGLADNTSFSITVPQKNGKDVIFHYVVVGRQQYAPTDQAQFKNTGKSLVALSTCWPVGSTQKRLVVFGELTQIEK